MSVSRMLLLAGMLALAACDDTPDPPTPETSAPPAEQHRAAPMVDDAPATVEQPAVIGFHGFGPARFGQDQEQVRMSWGRPLREGGSTSDSCYYLFREPQPDNGSFGIGFMIVDGKFARYDVDMEQFAAPGDIKVGATLDQLRETYAGRITEQPHKYAPDWLYVIVAPGDGSDARLVFEVNEEQVVTSWRIGVPPAVFYVEGCA